MNRVFIRLRLLLSAACLVLAHGFAAATGCNSTLGWADQLRTLAESDKGVIAITVAEKAIKDDAFKAAIERAGGTVKFASQLYDLCRSIENDRPLEAYLQIMGKAAELSGTAIGPYLGLLTRGTTYVLDELDRILTGIAPDIFRTNPEWRFEVQLMKPCWLVGLFWCSDSNTAAYVEQVDLIRIAAGAYSVEETVSSRICPVSSAPGECNSIPNPKALWVSAGNPLGDNLDNPSGDHYFLRIVWKLSDSTRYSNGSYKADKQITVVPIFSKQASNGLNPELKVGNVRNLSIKYYLKNSVFSLDGVR